MANTVWIVLGVIAGVILAVTILVGGIMLTLRRNKVEYLERGRLQTVQLPDSQHQVHVHSRPSADRPGFIKVSMGSPEDIAAIRAQERSDAGLMDKAIKRAARDPEYRKLLEAEFETGRFQNLADVYRPRLNLESSKQKVADLVTGIRKAIQ